jgi:hypothetical protein
VQQFVQQPVTQVAAAPLYGGITAAPAFNTFNTGFNNFASPYGFTGFNTGFNGGFANLGLSNTLGARTVAAPLYG